MNILKEIKSIIKEEQKRKTILLEEPTRPGRPSVFDDDDGEEQEVTKNGRAPVPTTKHDAETVIGKQNAKTAANNPGTKTAPNKTPNGTQVLPDTQPKPTVEKDFRPGFNLYHGVASQAFSELQSMSEDGAGDIARKVTQWALQKVGSNEDTEAVFQSNGGNNQQPIAPQDMLAIVQKAMLIILNHVSKEADGQVRDKGSFAGDKDG